MGSCSVGCAKVIFDAAILHAGSLLINVHAKFWFRSKYFVSCIDIEKGIWRHQTQIHIISILFMKQVWEIFQYVIPHFSFKHQVEINLHVSNSVDILHYQ